MAKRNETTTNYPNFRNKLSTKIMVWVLSGLMAAAGFATIIGAIIELAAK